MIKVLQFFQSSHRNPLHNDFARGIDRSQIELWGGTLTAHGDFHQDLQDMGIPSIAFKTESIRSYPRTTLRLALWLKRHHFDVVHTHSMEASLVGLSAARLAGVPFRVQTRHHTNERLLYDGRKALAGDKFVGRVLADRIIALSADVRRSLEEIDGVPNAKIVQISNGIDWNRVQSSPDASARLRTELNLPTQFLMAIVGRLTFVKAHRLLFEALSKLPAKHDWRLMIVGTGPEESQLREHAARCGVSERCLFLGHRRDVFDIMSGCDLIVHPSLHEAQCQVIYEAMGLGCPVVASDVGAASETLLPEKTGWIVPAADVTALHNAVEDAMKNADKRHQFASAGQKLARELYPIEKMAREHLELYQRELKKRGVKR